jgi:hypothetical protein
MILHAIHADKTFGESGIKGWIIVKSSTLKTVRLPIPNKDDVESHLVMACAAGKMLHKKTGLRNTL